jgi:hypothetical protein
MIRVEFEMTEAEYREAAAAADQQWQRWYRPLWTAGCVSAACGGAVLAATDGRHWLAPAALIVQGAFVMCYPWFRRGRAVAEGWREAAGVGPMTWAFDDDGVRWTSTLGDCRLGWHAFTGFRETRRLFVLRQVGSGDVHLPKRAAGDREGQAELRRLFQEKLDRPEPAFPVVTRPG